MYTVTMNRHVGDEGWESETILSRAIRPWVVSGAGKARVLQTTKANKSHTSYKSTREPSPASECRSKSLRLHKYLIVICLL